MTGAEALVRRPDATEKLVLPGRFILLFEEENIVRHIDLYALDCVCRLLGQRKSKGYELIPVSVNLSRISVMKDSIVEKLMEVCNRYEVSHDPIDIEITESISTMETSTLILLAITIKNAGFRLSLDDFSSQYSDFAILPLIDFAMIKLDKPLIDEIATNEKLKILL